MEAAFCKEVSHQEVMAKRGKMNKALQLAIFLKKQKLIHCDITTRKCRLLMHIPPTPLPTHASISVIITSLLFYLHFLV